MNTIIADFEDRAKEVKEYLSFLRALELPGSVLLYGVNRTRQESVFGTENFSVMKAAAFLMIYNLVESSIKSSIANLYEKIAQENKDISYFREEYLKLWIDHHFRKLDTDSATKSSFREHSESLIRHLLETKPLTLAGNSLPISGNLDARKIRQICNSHGIPSHVHYRAQGGYELQTVKEKRNNLGHGDVSFVECGRDYTVSDLERISKQSIIFIRSILKNIKDHSDRSQYVA